MSQWRKGKVISYDQSNSGESNYDVVDDDYSILDTAIFLSFPSDSFGFLNFFYISTEGNENISLSKAL